jgi:acyl-CoA synthetase (AMP-forming)/AMP-acid ligase II
MSEESRSIDGAVSSAGYIEASCGPSTLIDPLRFRAGRNPLQSAYTFLADREQEETYITYADLDERARAIAAQLQSLDCLGHRALLLFPPGLDYIAAFFGCVYSEAIAVPAYPPPQTRAEEKPHRLTIMVEDCGASLILCSSSIFSTLKTKSN